MLELLEILPTVDGLEDAVLGGGTSLALVYGHRRSVDLDFFLADSFDSQKLAAALYSRFPGMEVLNRTRGSLCVIADSVKIDLLHHPYPRLDEGQKLGALRLASRSDMAAMKVNAVTNRGSKKDFCDLLLLTELGIELPGAIEFFCRKYGPSGRFLALRSLAWFGDADAEPDPLFLNGWTWSSVRERMASRARALIV
jgi:hypothetical protein